MKTIYSCIVLLCISLTFIQCNSDSESSTTTKDLTSGKFVQGKVLIPASSIHKQGVIRAYIDENQEPKRLRGIMYSYEGNETFSLHEEVYFNVMQMGDKMYASNVTADDKSSEKFAGSIKYNMNLHVSHLEDGVHTKVHILKPPTGGNFQTYTAADGTELTKIEVYNIPESGSPDPALTNTIYVYSSAYATYDLDLDYYQSQTNIIDGKKVYNLSLTHDHIYD